MQSANAQRMRRSLTPAETKLWHALRHSIVLRGSHFRRQVPIGPYIADFCCFGTKLVVEVDGGHHFTDEAEPYDAARTRYLSNQGFRVLRFTNQDVLAAIDSVAETIRINLENVPTDIQSSLVNACLSSDGRRETEL